jgi:hypothetical protein
MEEVIGSIPIRSTKILPLNNLDTVNGNPNKGLTTSKEELSRSFFRYKQFICNISLCTLGA